MISIKKNKIENLIKVYVIDIKKQHTTALNKLENLLKKSRPLKHKDSKFLKNIITEFKKMNFVSISLDDIENIKTRIGEVHVSKRKFLGKKKATYLKDEILNALNYAGLRSS